MDEQEIKVDTKHADVARLAPLWEMCRDLNEGEPRIKADDVCRRYLPPLAGHLEDDGVADYLEYKSRAYFFGAFGRTIDGLKGLINRADPTVKVPPKMRGFLDDVTGQGLSLVEFSHQVVEEQIKVGRLGILTDWPAGDGRQRTIREAEADARRPFITLYYAESIINWRTRRMGAKVLLSMVVVQEQEELEGVSEFEVKVVQQIRVFDLDPAGFYRIRVFQLLKSSDPSAGGKMRWVQVGTDIYPLKQKQKLRELQFDFINATDTTFRATMPPLADLGFVVLSHYRNSADYENALKFLGNPQPYATGYDEARESAQQAADGKPPKGPIQKKRWRLGRGLWTFRDDKVRLGVLSAKSEDLSALENAMKNKRDDMVALGARMLARDKLAAETARAEELRRQPENSILGAIAQTGSKGLTKVLQRVADWMGLAGECSLQLNNAFFDQEMTPDELAMVIQGWHDGLWALSDARYLARRGDLIRRDRTDEQIDAELDAAGPPLSVVVALAKPGGEVDTPPGGDGADPPAAPAGGAPAGKRTIGKPRKKAAA